MAAGIHFANIGQWFASIHQELEYNPNEKVQ